MNSDTPFQGEEWQPDERDKGYQECPLGYPGYIRLPSLRQPSNWKSLRPQLSCHTV
jgi:hypothetical protein